MLQSSVHRRCCSSMCAHRCSPTCALTRGPLVPQTADT
jgi:hypothetical protein